MLGMGGRVVSREPLVMWLTGRAGGISAGRPGGNPCGRKRDGARCEVSTKGIHLDQPFDRVSGVHASAGPATSGPGTLARRDGRRPGSGRPGAGGGNGWTAGGAAAVYSSRRRIRARPSVTVTCQADGR